MHVGTKTPDVACSEVIYPWTKGDNMLFNRCSQASNLVQEMNSSLVLSHLMDTCGEGEVRMLGVIRLSNMIDGYTELLSSSCCSQ